MLNLVNLNKQHERKHTALLFIHINKYMQLVIVDY